MSSTFSGRFLGNKKTTILHEHSGSVITTDAPPDNNGDGTRFSPTDLIAAALCSCVMTVIDILAERDGFSVMGMRAEIEKQMTSSSPRRIASLPMTLYLPAALTPPQRQRVERAALGCPVHHSLHPDIEAPITFVYA